MKRIFYLTILFIIGLILLLLGVLIWFLFPLIVKTQIEKFLTLKNGTLLYKQWQNTSIPTYMEFYYFDIINSLEVENGEKPYLVQKGPYVYREYRIKENIQFNDNGTVTYMQRRMFIFDREKSAGSEDDTIKTLNLVLLILGNKIKSLPTVIKQIVQSIIKMYENTDIFMEISVKNITWGYTDPFIEEINKLIGKYIWIDPVIGLFHGKNNSYDGVYTVFIDINNAMDKFMTITAWNNSDHVNIWYTKYANMINGTDGSMFHPYLDKGKRVYSFQTDLCRSIYAEYTGSTYIKSIPSYIYQAPASLFANKSINHDNIGFCVDGKCLGSGVLNMSKCIPMAPIVMSQPHFYQAAQIYKDKIRGLKPNSNFATMLAMEPTTGLPLHVEKKLQVNVNVEKVPSFAKMDKLQDMFLPMMWLNESAFIDDDLANTLLSTLVIPVTGAKMGSIVAMVIGPVMLILIFVICVSSNKKKNNRNKVVNVNPPDCSNTAHGDNGVNNYSRIKNDSSEDDQSH